jgi:hypothetical protein
MVARLSILARPSSTGTRDHRGGLEKDRAAAGGMEAGG